jgi:type I restriction enzyme S subunit
VLQDAVLLSRLNPRTPRIWMPTSIGLRRAICSTEFAVLLPKAHASREWLYCLFSSQTFCDHLTTMVTGTSGSHQRVRPESLLAMPTVAPAEQVVQIFTKIIRPFLTRAAFARNESLTLAALRDALLPKLISGELRVGEAERILAASA